MQVKTTFLVTFICIYTILNSDYANHSSTNVFLFNLNYFHNSEDKGS